MASVKGGSYRTIEEICRVCLDTKSEKIPLSSCIIIDGKAVTISALLLLFTRLEELDSRLPPNLCISCVQHLENAQAFNRQCLKNNKFLLAQVNAEKKGGKRKKEDENGDSLTRINQIVKDWSTNKFPRILPKPSPAPPNAPSEAATPNTAVAAAVPRPSTVPLMATVPMAASVPAGGTAPPPAYVIVAPNENMKFVSCPHCAKCFVSANCLKTHIVQEHPFAFACTDCDKKFANSKELESHRGIHKKVKVVKVVQVQPRLEEKKVQPKPSRAGIDSSLVNLDLDVYHKEEALVLKSSQPPQPAVCCFCNRAYMSRDGLVQHFDRHSKSHHKFECVLCNRLFATRVVLNMHYIRVHQMSARVFFCGYCVEAKEAFVEDEAVAAHLLQHVSKSGENRAICTEEVDSEGDDGENRADSERNATICLEEAEYITSDLIIEEKSIEEKSATKMEQGNVKVKTESAESIVEYMVVDGNNLVQISPEEAFQLVKGEALVVVNNQAENQANDVIEIKDDDDSDVRVSFDCAICSTKFTRNRNLQRHMAAKHNAYTLRCRNCKLTFNAERTYNEHRKICKKASAQAKKSLKRSVSTCAICRLRFVSRKLMLAHVTSSHHGQTLTPNVEDHKYHCVICDKSLGTATGLKYHVRAHLGHPRERCDLCGKRFSASHALKHHVMSRHGGLESAPSARVECATCPRRFVSSYQLKRHERTMHLGERAYMCVWCGVRFRQSSHLRQHEWRHTGVKGHRCRYCDAKYAGTHGLKYHYRKAHSEQYKKDLEEDRERYERLDEEEKEREQQLVLDADAVLFETRTK